MPPLQEEIRTILIEEYGLPFQDASQLADDSDLSTFFFELVKITSNYKAAAKWVMGPIRNYLIANELVISESGIQPLSIAGLIKMIDEEKISYGIATQQVFAALVKNSFINIEEFVKENKLSLEHSLNETDIWIEAALQKHAQKIQEYKKGKKGLISVFVGEVMKLSKGRADARLVTEKITEKLKHHS